MRGLPTSLTLAVVGAITGAGLGGGLPVSWRWVGFVLLVAAVAPLLGAALAAVASRALGRLPGRGPAHRRIRVFHHVAYLGQCLAYGLNDGQKMLAVAGIALGSTAAIATPPLWLPIVIGAAFLLGAILGLRRVSGTLGEALAPVRPPVAVVAAAAAAGAVLVSTALHAPVSMTQSLAGALVGGSGASHSYRRVRWAGAARILVAWLLTLPAAVVVAAVTMRVVG
jgi:PiT family inorganic phosphate transporter